MKIGITGAHNTGKTTLAKKLAKYYNLLLVPECARELITDANINWREDSSSTKLLLQSGIALAYYAYFSLYRNESFIADRLPIDVIAYTLLIDLYPNNPIGKTLISDVLRKLRFGVLGLSFSYMEDLTNQLDLIIFLRDYNGKDSIAVKVDNYIASFLYMYSKRPPLEFTSKKHYESIEMVVPLIDQAVSNS
jgi:hypothetical protein